MQIDNSNAKSKSQTTPWWSFGYVWLLISGPLLVIIASFITLYIAMNNPDPVIDNYYRKGMEINKRLNAQRDQMAPAVQARNNAATGIKPAK